MTIILFIFTQISPKHIHYGKLAMSQHEAVINQITNAYRSPNLLSNLKYKMHQIPKMFVVLSCTCLFAIYWSQVLSWKWRCSWSSAEKRCSNYIWVIDNFIAH